MLRMYFYETEDFNGELITDGTRAWDISSFPQDGTLADAFKDDIGGIEGCETLDEMERAIGVPLKFFNFNEDDFDRIFFIREV